MDQQAKQGHTREIEGFPLPRLKPDGTITPEWERVLPPLWPEKLLPLCEWWHGVNTYIYADTERVFQGIHGPDDFVAASLEEWLERWLAGENLYFYNG